MQTAAGVHRIVNTQMAEGIRLATVRRGVDPRRFALLGFGGAAGLHATELARMLRIERVVLPTTASVLSAWGMLTSDLRLETARSFFGATDDVDRTALAAAFDAIEAEGLRRMRGWHDGDIRTSRSADMRYGEQIFEIGVPLVDIDFADDAVLTAVKQAFEARHEALYTYSLPDEHPLLVSLRVVTEGRIGDGPGAGVLEPSAARGRRRRIHLDEWLDVPALTLAEVEPGRPVHGPAVIDSETTTVLLRPGDCATLDARGWCDVVVG